MEDWNFPSVNSGHNSEEEDEKADGVTFKGAVEPLLLEGGEKVNTAEQEALLEGLEHLMNDEEPKEEKGGALLDTGVKGLRPESEPDDKLDAEGRSSSVATKNIAPLMRAANKEKINEAVSSLEQTTLIQTGLFFFL